MHGGQIDLVERRVELGTGGVGGVLKNLRFPILIVFKNDASFLSKRALGSGVAELCNSLGETTSEMINAWFGEIEIGSSTSSFLTSRRGVVVDVVVEESSCFDPSCCCPCGW